MHFLMRTFGHCACLNLLAIGLTELGVPFFELVYLVLLLLAGSPMCLYSLKGRQINRSGLVEDSYIRLGRFNGLLKLIFYWVVLLTLPYFALYDAQSGFRICTLGFGLRVNMGIFQQLVEVYVIFQSFRVLRVDGQFPSQKQKK